MLKLRIAAIFIAIILTIGTIYLIPIVAYYYTGFVGSLSSQQRVWFSCVQALIGFSIGIYGYWCWKKKQKSKK